VQDKALNLAWFKGGGGQEMIPLISAIFHNWKGGSGYFLSNFSQMENLTNGEVVIIFASEKKKGGMNDG